MKKILVLQGADGTFVMQMNFITYFSLVTICKIIINSKFMLFKRLLNWKGGAKILFVTTCNKMIDSVLSHCGFWKVQVQKGGNKNDVVISWTIY
jgi:hypothetical protein